MMKTISEKILCEFFDFFLDPLIINLFLSNWMENILFQERQLNPPTKKKLKKIKILFLLVCDEWILTVFPARFSPVRLHFVACIVMQTFAYLVRVEFKPTPPEGIGFKLV